MCVCVYIYISSVQSLSCVRLFATPCITARQASLSITNSQSSLKLTSIESMLPSSHLIYLVCVLSFFSDVQLYVVLWTVALQAPLSMVFSRQEYWSELPSPPPRGSS